MNKNIEHYFFHKENFLDNKKCDNYVKELNQNVWKKHNWYSSQDDLYYNPGTNEQEPDIITQEIFSPDIKKINGELVEELHPIILEYIQSFKFDWFVGWKGYSPMKFIRYHPGNRMENHCDHIHSMFDGKRKGIPILSIIGLLNDDFEGGDLIMFEDKKIDIKKGDVVIFPSHLLYPHEITSVIKGMRYSYTSWVW